jgi:hypothetical protein
MPISGGMTSNCERTHKHQLYLTTSDFLVPFVSEVKLAEFDATVKVGICQVDIDSH